MKIGCIFSIYFFLKEIFSIYFNNIKMSELH